MFNINYSPKSRKLFSFKSRGTKWQGYPNFYYTIILRKEISGEPYLAKMIDAIPRNMIGKKYS